MLGARAEAKDVGVEVSPRECEESVPWFAHARTHTTLLRRLSGVLITGSNWRRVLAFVLVVGIRSNTMVHAQLAILRKHALFPEARALDHSFKNSPD